MSDKKQTRTIFLLEFKMGPSSGDNLQHEQHICLRNCLQMYSVVVVQEIFQRRWELWRWGVQWPAIRSWQWPTEIIIETDPLTTTQEVACPPLYGPLAFEAKGKVRKLGKWVPHVCVCAKLLQSYPTLCDAVDCNSPGSSVHGILQARILEWGAVAFSRGSSWPRDQTCISYVSCIGSQVLYH